MDGRITVEMKPVHEAFVPLRKAFKNFLSRPKNSFTGEKIIMSNIMHGNLWHQKYKNLGEIVRKSTGLSQNN